MKYYAAPMEGLTGYIYRRAHHRVFPGVDRYYTPFIMPGQKVLLRAKEARDLLPENNAGIPVVPQILSNQAEDFLHTAAALHDLGYTEVNLNLGCPSGTVASKHRGAGFLALPEELDRFLEAIFAACPTAISIKTRIGVENAEEFPAILDIYNRYPVKELTVHPRLLKQKYRGYPDREAFAYALTNSRCPVCFNGDLFTRADVEKTAAEFPGASALMLGRGLMADPALAQKAQGGPACDKVTLRRFHDLLLEDFLALQMGDKNVLFRVKELWFYMIHLFPDSAKFAKAINKSQHLSDYLSAIERLFAERNVMEESDFRGTP